jgi:hypothetical protein
LAASGIMRGPMSEQPDQGRPGAEPAHDVLAAEAFAVPARDPSLGHAPVVLPDDPSGISEPHDILAAEEFAMPAGRGDGSSSSLARHASRKGPFVLAILLAVVMGLRRLRRSSRR